MRRKDKEIVDKNILMNILIKSIHGRLGLSLHGRPYVIPISFVYEPGNEEVSGTIYIHSAPEGKKIDIIKKNVHVCFQVDNNISVVRGDTPCNWGMKYQSVICTGEATIVDNFDEKKRVLMLFADKYTGVSSGIMDKAIHGTLLIRIDIRSITGKQSG